MTRTLLPPSGPTLGAPASVEGTTVVPVSEGGRPLGVFVLQGGEVRWHRVVQHRGTPGGVLAAAAAAGAAAAVVLGLRHLLPHPR